MESELLVEALGSSLLSLVNVDNLPSLVSVLVVVSISGANSNLLAFIILGLVNIKYLVVGRVDEELTVELEDLEPS
jgi:hypothetical protein